MAYSIVMLFGLCNADVYKRQVLACGVFEFLSDFFFVILYYKVTDNFLTEDKILW